MKFLCAGSIRGGLLRPIAVASSKRLGVLPAVPTFEEAGTPMLASAWYGITLPRETPSDVVQRLNTELNKILRSAEVRQKLIDMGAEVGGGSASEFAGFMAAEIKRYEGVVKDSGAPRE